MIEEYYQQIQTALDHDDLEETQYFLYVAILFDNGYISKREMVEYLKKKKDEIGETCGAFIIEPLFELHERPLNDYVERVDSRFSDDPFIRRMSKEIEKSPQMRKWTRKETRFTVILFLAFLLAETSKLLGRELTSVTDMRRAARFLSVPAVSNTILAYLMEYLWERNKTDEDEGVEEILIGLVHCISVYCALRFLDNDYELDPEDILSVLDQEKEDRDQGIQDIIELYGPLALDCPLREKEFLKQIFMIFENLPEEEAEMEADIYAEDYDDFEEESNYSDELREFTEYLEKNISEKQQALTFEAFQRCFPSFEKDSDLFYHFASAVYPAVYVFENFRDILQDYPPFISAMMAKYFAMVIDSETDLQEEEISFESSLAAIMNIFAIPVSESVFPETDRFNTLLVSLGDLTKDLTLEDQSSYIQMLAGMMDSMIEENYVDNSSEILLKTALLSGNEEFRQSAVDLLLDLYPELENPQSSLSFPTVDEETMDETSQPVQADRMFAGFLMAGLTDPLHLLPANYLMCSLFDRFQHYDDVDLYADADLYADDLDDTFDI